MGACVRVDVTGNVTVGEKERIRVNVRDNARVPGWGGKNAPIHGRSLEA